MEFLVSDLVFCVVIRFILVDPEPVSSNVVRSKWELIEYGNDSTSDDDGPENTSNVHPEQSKSKIDIKPILSAEDHNRQLLRDVEVVYYDVFCSNYSITHACIAIGMIYKKHYGAFH